MSTDISRNKQVVRDKFDTYLDEMIGPDSVAYERFVEGHHVTRVLRKKKLRQLRTDLKEQRDIILDYAEACLTADEDADILRDPEAVLADDAPTDDVDTSTYVDRFLDTNPFLNEFAIDPHVADDIHAAMIEHFFYITDQLQELLATGVPDDADDAWGALLRETYDTVDTAKDVLQQNFAYTNQLKDYRDDISLGWKGLLTTASFTDDVWPVLEKGEEQLGRKIAEELDGIYG